MERHKSLPFAMYDLAVYLPGGVVFLALFQIWLHGFGINFSLPLFHTENDQIGTFVRALIWLSAGYLTGHVLAFISSYFVEKLVHNFLGYPAAVWLYYEAYFEDQSRAIPSNKEMFLEIRKNLKSNRVSRIITYSQIPVLFPLSVLDYFGFLGFYAPKIPFGLRGKVAGNLSKIGIDLEVRPGTRWEKIVEHFVANNGDSAYGRMYNYLIIYGALRMMAFITLVMIWLMFIQSGYFWIENRSGILGGFSLASSAIYFALIPIYGVSLMAFAKFNRRYFEESLLAFVLHKFE